LRRAVFRPPGPAFFSLAKESGKENAPEGQGVPPAAFWEKAGENVSLWRAKRFSRDAGRAERRAPPEPKVLRGVRGELFQKFPPEAFQSPLNMI
ncbi:hypothetical protein, partial [Anaerotruncus massiliensis (ex Liu et al. 2021)]|uniref:hypothetical protein n=1 Tax=Anaerotruncus massiliensis (ex Liu et al. 2021) TaxID=2321404 RepID=UPI003AB55C72